MKVSPTGVHSHESTENSSYFQFNTSNNVDGILDASDFPEWFKNIVLNGEIYEIIHRAFQSQVVFLLFSVKEREWILKNFGLRNVIFLENHEGMAPNDGSIRGYCISDDSIKDSSYQSFLKRICSQSFHNGQSDLHIGIYPSRIRNFEDIIATINHEVHHWLMQLRIAFDFRNSGKLFFEYKEWINGMENDLIRKNRRQFIFESLAYLEGGHSLMQYGNSGDANLHNNSGMSHSGKSLYNQAARFASKLMSTQIGIYNYLGGKYGFNTNKPKNFQLVDIANNQFQKYGRKVVRLMLDALYDQDVFEYAVILFMNNKPEDCFVKIMELSIDV